MHSRSTRPAGRTRYAAFTAAAVLGLGAALAGVHPAMAATPPTLSGPATTVGFSRVTLTGKADPNARVTLVEAAYIFRGDMNVAIDHRNGDVIDTVADDAGNFTLSRTMDSGFVFAAQTAGGRSDVITVEMVARPSLELAVSGTDAAVTVRADPNESYIPVRIERYNGTGWDEVAQGNLPEQPKPEENRPPIPYTTTLTGLAAGQRTYFRAGLGASPANAVRLGYSDTVEIVTGGSGGPPPTTPPTTPPPTTPPTTPPPTTPPTAPPSNPSPPPVPGPSKPTPAKPAPAPPKRTEVRFSLVQYDPPGTDRSTNAGYNQEYLRLTNYSAKAVNLKNTTVTDRSGHTYRFTTDAVLQPKKNLYVLTGKGVNGKPSTYRYWGRSSYVWNNGGDAATLRVGKTVIDSCAWGKGGGRTYC